MSNAEDLIHLFNTVCFKSVSQKCHKWGQLSLVLIQFNNSCKVHQLWQEQGKKKITIWDYSGVNGVFSCGQTMNMILPEGTVDVFPPDVRVSDPRPAGSHPEEIGEPVTEPESWGRAGPAVETPQTRPRHAAPPSQSASCSAAPALCTPPATVFPSIYNSIWRNHWSDIVSLLTLTAVLITTWFSRVVLVVCVAWTFLWAKGMNCSSWEITAHSSRFTSDNVSVGRSMISWSFA